MNSVERHTVLLVDGNPDMSAAYSHGLLKAGFVVTTAAGARAALSAINNEPPEFIILDWQMAEMRGDELLGLLARDPQTRNLRVLFLSDTPSDDPVVAAAMAAQNGQHRIEWLFKSTTTSEDLANHLLSALNGHLEPTPGN